MFLILVGSIGNFFYKNQIVSAKTAKESQIIEKNFNSENENISISPSIVTIDEEGNIFEHNQLSLDFEEKNARAVDPIWGNWGSWQKNYTYSTSVTSAKGITSLGANNYQADLNWTVTMKQGDTHAVIPFNYGAFGVYANRTTSVTPKGYTVTGDTKNFVNDDKATATTLPSTGTGFAQIKTWYEGTTLYGGPQFYFISDVTKYAFYSPTADGYNHQLNLDVKFNYTTTDPNGYTRNNQGTTGSTYYYPSAPWEPQLIKAKYIDMDTGIDIGQGVETQGINGYLYDKYMFTAKDIANYTYQYRVESDDTGASTKITDSSNKTVEKKLGLAKQGIVFYYKKESKSAISVNKYDAENRTTRLANASIQLYDSSKKLLDTKVTNATSATKFENLALGSYYLKESTAPSGYGIDNLDYIPITLTETGASYNFYDTKLKVTSAISVNKYDAENRTTRLANASIQLYDSSKKLLDTKVTNATSATKFENLALGSYYLKESTAPSGYGIDNPDYIPITLTATGVSYSFYDTKLKVSNTIAVNKYDKDNPTKRLAGAGIQLYDANKTPIVARFTSATAATEFTNLSLGTYYLKEIFAPDGYEIDNPDYVKITLTGASVSYSFYDTKTIIKSTISVNKYDRNSPNQRLFGARILLYDANKNAIDASITSATETTKFTDLPLGTYYLQERFAPVGYEIDNPDYIPITLTESGVTYDFFDTKIITTSTISVNKYDAVDRTTKLANANIQLYDSNKKLLDTKMTSATSTIKFENLEFGIYYLKESTAPSGYGIDNPDYVPITLTASGITYDFYDSELTGKIIAIKKDVAENNRLLSGAGITLYDEKQKEISAGVTNEKGEVIFPNLKKGNYYLKETKAPEGYKIDNPNFILVNVGAGEDKTYFFYDTKLTSEVNLNIRQVVLYPNEELVIPTTGYFFAKETKINVLDENKTYGIDSKSSAEKGSNSVGKSDFTTYKLNLSSEYKFIYLSTIIPQYYNLVGYQATTNQATVSNDHSSIQTINKPNSSSLGNSSMDIQLDYTKEIEYYVSVYIEPNQYVKPEQGKTKSPGYYNWDYSTNKFNYIK